jgi:hypothetical protein
MMALYTFIMDYRGGTYAAQVRATSVQTAARQWAEKLAVDAIWGFGPAAQRQLRARVWDDKPVPLDGLESVWCLSAIVRGHLALINVIETTG